MLSKKSVSRAKWSLSHAKRILTVFEGLNMNSVIGIAFLKARNERKK